MATGQFLAAARGADREICEVQGLICQWTFAQLEPGLQVQVQDEFLEKRKQAGTEADSQLEGL